MLNNLFSLKRVSLLICFLFAAVATPVTPVFAQDDDPAAEETEEQAGPQGRSLWGQIKAGGWAMIPLGGLSVIGVGLFFYNLLMIREKPFLRPDVIESLEEPIRQLNIEEVRRICDDNPTAVTNIFYAGLERIHGGEIDLVSIEKAMDEAATDELAGPFVFINYLNIIASVSPMVGLLGTVSGMVKAFTTIAQEGMGRPELLADNISEALVTTATGLIVAIPALITYFYFKNKYGRLASRVSRLTGDLYFQLVHAVNRHSG